MLQVCSGHGLTGQLPEQFNTTGLTLEWTVLTRAESWPGTVVHVQEAHTGLEPHAETLPPASHPPSQPTADLCFIIDNKTNFTKGGGLAEKTIFHN